MTLNLGRAKGTDGKGIESIERIEREENIDTYRITFTNGDTFDYTITNGKDAINAIVTSWEETLSDTKAPSEKLVKNTIDSLIGEAIIYINK